MSIHKIFSMFSGDPSEPPREIDRNLTPEIFRDNSELTNFAACQLDIMDDVESDTPVCQRCRRLSSSLNKTQARHESLMAAKSNSVHSHSTSKDNIYYVRTNSFPPPDSVDVRDDHYSVNYSDDTPFVLDDQLGSDSDDSHCHVSEPRVSLSTVRARRQLIISSILCLFFMLGEIIGGYFANSLAIMTDAAHMLSDCASFMISLFAIWMGEKAPTRRMSFGYYRAEVLGAVTSVLIIWLVTGVIVYMAVERVIKQEFIINADIMLIVSGCGVAMNIMMGIVLHGMCNCHTHSHLGGHGHSHSHGHSHDASDSSHKSDGQNINVRAAFIHVIGDLIQSIGVLIAAYIIKYKPEYKLADPICTFIFSVLVLFTTIAILKDALYVLMEAFPKSIDYFTVISDLTKVPGVKAVHSLHIWSLTMDKNALSVHLAIDQLHDSQEVLREALNLVRKKYRIFHPTIQVEVFDTNMTSCPKCIGPQK